MSNGAGNRLSIPELEDQIALLQVQLRRLQQPLRPHGMYACTDCGLLYQSVWGCGCVTKHLRSDARRFAAATTKENAGPSSEPLSQDKKTSAPEPALSMTEEPKG